MDEIVYSWEFACGHIPTRYIRFCYRNALQAKTDSYPLTVGQLNKQWEELKQQLLRDSPSSESVPLLPPPPSSGLMTITQFKARHNLPVDWKLGDPYPECSDLYNKPVPPNPEETRLYRCYRCKDSGWLREPYNHVTHKVELVPCACK